MKKETCNYIQEKVKFLDEKIDSVHSELNSRMDNLEEQVFKLAATVDGVDEKNEPDPVTVKINDQSAAEAKKEHPSFKLETGEESQKRLNECESEIYKYLMEYYTDRYTRDAIRLITDVAKNEMFERQMKVTPDHANDAIKNALAKIEKVFFDGPYLDGYQNDENRKFGFYFAHIDTFKGTKILIDDDLIEARPDLSEKERELVGSAAAYNLILSPKFCTEETRKQAIDEATALYDSLKPAKKRQRKKTKGMASVESYNRFYVSAKVEEYMKRNYPEGYPYYNYLIQSEKHLSEITYDHLMGQNIINKEEIVDRNTADGIYMMIESILAEHELVFEAAHPGEYQKRHDEYELSKRAVDPTQIFDGTKVILEPNHDWRYNMNNIKYIRNRVGEIIKNNDELRSWVPADTDTVGLVTAAYILGDRDSDDLTDKQIKRAIEHVSSGLSRFIDKEFARRYPDYCDPDTGWIKLPLRIDPLNGTNWVDYPKKMKDVNVNNMTYVENRVREILAKVYGEGNFNDDEVTTVTYLVAGSLIDRGAYADRPTEEEITDAINDSITKTVNMVEDEFRHRHPEMFLSKPNKDEVKPEPKEDDMDNAIEILEEEEDDNE